MRQFLSLVLLLFLPVFLIAQAADSLSADYHPRPAIKFVPLPLFDLTPAIQFAIELQTFRNQSIQFEYGYVDNLYIRKADFRGLKLKGEYRFYFNFGGDAAKHNFLGLQYMRKDFDTKAMVPVWKDNMSYQEIIPLTIANKSNSIYVVAGHIFTVNRHFYLEGEIGTGIKILDVSVEGVPENAFFDGILRRDAFNPVNRVGTYYLPSLVISFKFIFAL